MAAVDEFNRLRAAADLARRELIIHRQAIGFQTANYAAIEKAWPLPAKRVVAAPCAPVVEERTYEDELRDRNRSWMERMEKLCRK